jgi:hypothetical protein
LLRKSLQITFTALVSEYYFLIASHILEFESYEEKAKKPYENKEIRVFSLTERRSWYKSSQGYMQQ